MGEWGEVWEQTFFPMTATQAIRGGGGNVILAGLRRRKVVL